MDFIENVLSRESDSNLLSDAGYDKSAANNELYKRSVSYKTAHEKLFALVGEKGEITLLNSNDRVSARLSKSSIGKLMSNDAAQKTVGNGFTREQHYAAVSDIDELFKNSLKIWSHPDRKGNPTVKIHRFAAPLHIDSGVAYITVKESTQHGKRVYSTELMEIKKLGGILEEAGQNPLHTSPAPSFYDSNIRKLIMTVNAHATRVCGQETPQNTNQRAAEVSPDPQSTII